MGRITLEDWRNVQKQYPAQAIDQILAVPRINQMFRDSSIDQDVLIEWFKDLDAMWIHSGDPKDPHVELTSGKCSNGFFDCLRVLKFVTISEVLAYQLAKKIQEKLSGQKIDWVIGSPMAGITFAHDVARALGARVSMFVEKDSQNPGKMTWKRMTVPQGALVLQIEELVTTAKTLNAVQEAVDAMNQFPVNWFPYFGVLVHRPANVADAQYGDRQLIALIERQVWAVDPHDCPLCKQGSKRYRAKTHWKELTGKGSQA